MWNRTRERDLGRAVDIADTSGKRRVGLLKHERLETGEGLWIVPCESVHTFFMKFPIDLVYLDRRHKVRKVRSAVPPSAAFFRLSVRPACVLELPAGTVERSGTQTGDKLLVEELKDIRAANERE